MPANILSAIRNISHFKANNLRNYSSVYLNRINAVGEQLEFYVKDAFAGTFKLPQNEKEKVHSKVFSYLGNQNNPPDLILKGGDAFEIKKIQSKGSSLALNSSHPKAKLYNDDSRITASCKKCEKEPWKEKDFFYVIGHTEAAKLKYLFFVQGSCYAAERETYERIEKPLKKEIKRLIRSSGLEGRKTNELGKINRVDPLGITDLRIRGMWHIKNPLRVFGDICNYDPSTNFSLFAIMEESKYLSFLKKDASLLPKGDLVEANKIKIKDPNNPAREMGQFLSRQGGNLKVISLFSGCGGLDLGFENAGFKIAYANDFDKKIKDTFEKNHGVPLDVRSIVNVKSSEIPDADGIIGGPPCQSWSLAGSMKGAKDERGQLFYEYIRVLRDKKPLFFVAENVPGIISRTHLPEFKKLLHELGKVGYKIAYKLVDARDYGVSQKRKRVIIVGYREDLAIEFSFPPPSHLRDKWLTLKDAIGDLPAATPARKKNRANMDIRIPNHEYMNGGFSTIYMSRNRRKKWNEASFTIQAGGRHAPLHPNSAKMVKVGPDKWKFKGKNPEYWRMSVRECARVQTFPDDFLFYYDNIADGYKMVGNAVPVKLSTTIAKTIKKDIAQYKKKMA